MTDPISRFVDALKRRLAANTSKFVKHFSYLGCTEGGFYSADEFDFDNLLEEIDQFAAEFKSDQAAPPDTTKGKQ